MPDQRRLPFRIERQSRDMHRVPHTIQAVRCCQFPEPGRPVTAIAAGKGQLTIGAERYRGNRAAMHQGYPDGLFLIDELPIMDGLLVMCVREPGEVGTRITPDGFPTDQDRLAVRAEGQRTDAAFAFSDGSIFVWDSIR